MLYTSEQVALGHPDRTCDYSADCILDEALRQDPDCQGAVECAIKNERLFLYGEMTTTAKLDYEEIAREALRYVGYPAGRFQITLEISRQSPNINAAVLGGEELGAGDQGLCFGYACDETPEFMPRPIALARRITNQYDSDLRSPNAPFLLPAALPDMKTQVTYEDDKLHTIVISASHLPGISQDRFRDALNRWLDECVLQPEERPKAILINPSGEFSVWGSYADSGCVGRKIVCDSYGSAARVGGGCFSSKSPTKVDRSGALYARHAALSVVAYGLAHSCEVCASYVIGQPRPVSVSVEAKLRDGMTQTELEGWIARGFDFSVANIIQELDLKRPIFADCAMRGHFGRPGALLWECVKDVPDGPLV
jgi:S-adenosylmethionine synthetase